MKHTENLIVGLGIAGVNLCHQLEKEGKTFLVIDRCPSNSASLIAGGIYNPVVLKRKIKSWMVDDLFPVLAATYKELEEKLEVDILNHDFPILKPISSADEMTEWNTAVEDKSISPYVNAVSNSRPSGPFQESVQGSVTIENAGFLRIRKLVLAYREYLKEKGLLIESEFELDKLKCTESDVQYMDIEADRIIFSEGRFISENPFFNWIPFNPTKGQMLTVKVDLPIDATKVYNQQFLFFPTEEENIFRLGATYSWNQTDEEPTEEGTIELLGKLRKALNVEVEVLEAKAAIRPTVSDRRPTIGVHPEQKNVFLFNGMGSKGVMLAPYFAKELVDFIYAGKELNPEADLQRWVRKHYKKS